MTGHERRGWRPPGVIGRRRTEAIQAALEPVASSLVRAAEGRAQTIRDTARTEADATVANAERDAERILAGARADGAQAAATEVAHQLGVARRQSRELVLAARRRAFEALRQSAVESLVRRAAAPDGQWVGPALIRDVTLRVGAPASVSVGPSSLSVAAESGNRRAAIGPAALVDQALESLPDEVEALWA